MAKTCEEIPIPYSQGMQIKTRMRNILCLPFWQKLSPLTVPRLIEERAMVTHLC
jgi:hypothetical protein